MDLEPQTITYLSSLPGGGKTTWAINQLRVRIQKKRGITIYTAPTWELLKDIGEKIQEGLDPTEQRRVILVTEELKTGLGYRTLYELTRTLIRAVYKEIKLRTVAIGPYGAGVVLLMTHEAFLRLKSGFRDDGKPWVPRRHQIHVIFDEAQKCVLESEKLILPASLAQAVEPLLGLQELVNTREPKSLNSKPSPSQWAAAISHYKNEHPVSKSLRRTVDALTSIVSDIYGSNVQIIAQAQRRRAQDGSMSILFQSVMDPARVLHGWKSVTIMAAAFQQTQMYHVLSRSSIDPHPYEDDQMFQKRLDRIQTPIRIQSKIVPEIEIQERAIRRCWAGTYMTYASSGQRALSKGALDTGVVIESEDGFNTDLWIQELMDINARSEKPLGKAAFQVLLQDVVSDTGGSIRALNTELHEYIRTLPGLQKLTPVQYLVKRALSIHRAWHEAQGIKDIPLLPYTINAGTNKEYQKSVDQLNLDGLLPMEFKSQGSNKYLDYHVMAFLASINPEPEVKNIMKRLCPYYDPRMDHIVEQAVQSLARSSIRDPREGANRLLILPDEETARIVWAKGFDHLPKLIHPSEIPNLGIGPGVSKATVRELRQRYSIVKLRIRSNLTTDSGVGLTATQLRTPIAKHLRSVIPEYSELINTQRKLKAPRAKYDLEAMSLRVRELEAKLRPLINQETKKFLAKLDAGPEFRPSL